MIGFTMSMRGDRNRFVPGNGEDGIDRPFTMACSEEKGRFKVRTVDCTGDGTASDFSHCRLPQHNRAY